MKRILWEFLFSIEENKLFSSVKKGFMITVPMVLIGTIAVLLNSIVLPLLESVFSTAFLDGCSLVCTTIYGATVGCLSIYLSVAIGYYYAQAQNVHNMLVRLLSVFTGVICFVILIGGLSAPNFQSYIGVVGVLPAIVVTLISVSAFIALTNFMAKKYKDLGVEDNLKVSPVSILPMLFTILGCVVLQYLATSVFHIGDLYETLSAFFQTLFTGSTHSLFTAMLFTVLVNLLWVLGIHGGNVMNPISEEFLVPLVSDPDSIISKSFLDVFAQLGGSGATLCLLLAILIAAKSKSTRSIGCYAAPMILFNINELMVFGLPIIFNPIMAIPFVLVPIVSLCIAYVATAIGWVPMISQTVSWTTPIFFSGYLGTGSIHGVLLQLLILACGTALYLPFVKLLEQFQVEKELRILNQLITTFRHNEATGVSKPMLTRTDALGQTARMMAHQLRLDVESGNIPLFYQPQMDANDTVVGGEALLRWQYQGSIIYPPFVVALAKEEGIIDQMTLLSAQVVCHTIAQLEETTTHSLHIALNITANQLNNTDLMRHIIAMVKDTDTKNQLHLELTEETSLSGFVNIDNNIRHLCANGIAVAIDDFGMGHTSINYLKEHTFKYVKIDGSLVTHVLTNPRCSQIITSIVELGHSLNYQVVAEYVETIEIKQGLMELGCTLFQGYYYSPALPKESFIQYCVTSLEQASTDS